VAELRPNRNDDVEIKLPMGVTVRASGRQVSLIILVVLGIGVVLWMVREHDVRAKESEVKIIEKQQELVETVENVGYILTLNEADRKKLRLDMPPKLRKQLLENERRDR